MDKTCEIVETFGYEKSSNAEAKTFDRSNVDKNKTVRSTAEGKKNRNAFEKSNADAKTIEKSNADAKTTARRRKKVNADAKTTAPLCSRREEMYSIVFGQCYGCRECFVSFHFISQLHDIKFVRLSIHALD